MLKEGLGKGPYLKEQWYKIQKSASLLAARLGTFRSFGAERARVGTFRGFGS